MSLLANAGLRPEEAFALTWPDIRDKLIIVDKAVALGETKETKTNKTRTVEMVDVLQEDLAAYRKSLPITPGPGSFVFPHPQDPSRPWGDATYRNWRARIFKPAAERAGLGHMNPYDLRHSFVSLLLMSGRRSREVAEQAGHSVSVMESTYSHIIEEFRGAPMTDASKEIRDARSAVAKQRQENVS